MKLILETNKKKNMGKFSIILKANSYFVYNNCLFATTQLYEYETH